MLLPCRVLTLTELLIVICAKDSCSHFELSRWKWQQKVKWLVVVRKGQEGLDLKCARILI